MYKLTTKIALVGDLKKNKSQQDHGCKTNEWQDLIQTLNQCKNTIIWDNVTAKPHSLTVNGGKDCDK